MESPAWHRIVVLKSDAFSDVIEFGYIPFSRYVNRVNDLGGLPKSATLALSRFGEWKRREKSFQLIWICAKTMLAPSVTHSCREIWEGKDKIVPHSKILGFNLETTGIQGMSHIRHLGTGKKSNESVKEQKLWFYFPNVFGNRVKSITRSIVIIRQKTFDQATSLMHVCL